MRPSLSQWLITLILIWFGVSLGSAVQTAATAGPVDLAASSPTAATDQDNTLPAVADRVQVTIAGAESITEEVLRSTLPDPSGTGQLTFYLAAGQYTCTAQALQAACWPALFSSRSALSP